MSSTPRTKSKTGEEVRFLDQALRPTTWSEYIGQETTKKNLQVLLRAAQRRSHPPEHLLFYGPAGLGKTTLAHLIAIEIGGQMKITSGPVIEKVGDLASLLTNLSPGDILFIDEIHRLNKNVEEVLYPAMESGVIDIMIGKGPSARAIQLELPPFTLIAATTRIALLSSPLRSRFSGGIFRLDFYTQDEIADIIGRSAALLGVSIDRTACSEIAKRSRFTPRTANYLLKRCRDFAQIHPQNGKTSSKRNKGSCQSKCVITKQVVEAAMDLLEVDSLGLSPSDRHILETIITKFNGGPVGLGTIAAATAEEVGTIEEVHEPYLIRGGLIERTPRGRVATIRAYEHLGYPVPQNIQQKLI
jgi:Holliday junction DNA helicase RuvB